MNQAKVEVYRVKAIIRSGEIKLIGQDKSFENLTKQIKSHYPSFTVRAVGENLYICFNPKFKVKGLGYPRLDCDKSGQVIKFVRAAGKNLVSSVAPKKGCITLYRNGYYNRSHYF